MQRARKSTLHTGLLSPHPEEASPIEPAHDRKEKKLNQRSGRHTDRDINKNTAKNLVAYSGYQEIIA